MKAGIRIAAPFLFLLLSVTDAHAMYSYSQVSSTLRELSASSAMPGGPHLQVVQIGSTVKGRPILMAVLSASPVEAPQLTVSDEPASGEAPAPGVDAPEGEAQESAPGEPAPPAGGSAASAPAAPASGAGAGAPASGAGAGAAAPSAAAANSLVLTLEPEGEETPPVIESPQAGAQTPADDLDLQSQDAPRRVLIMCRQHGNEPASTEAVMQFLKEYATTDDPAKMELLRRVTFLVVPMLNIDGAEEYQRRNARNVDLNRDWLAQSQPETQAVVRAARAWRPDLIMDLHELAASDWTPSFVEAMEPEAGTTAEIGDACNAAIAAVVGPLRQRSMRIYARPVFNYREPRLAHRYFAIKRAIPSILVENRRAGSVPLKYRSAVHYAAVLAAAHYLAGEKADTPPRVIAEWVEPDAAESFREMEARRNGGDPAVAAALAERRATLLASRKARADLAKKRAELARKLAAQKRKQRR